MSPSIAIVGDRFMLPRVFEEKIVEACGPELTIQDWGVNYDELEPHYDRFEYLCGVCGKAGNIKGLAVTGRKATPPLWETMVALGKEITRRRLRRAADWIGARK